MSALFLLETERLELHGWTVDQLDDLVRLHGDPDTAKYLRDNGEPWTVEQCRTALLHWIDLFESRRMGKMRLIRKADGVLVGRCGFGVEGPDEIPEIGFSLYPEYRGMGYATEAATALRDWLFAKTEWDHFLGMADTRNLRSIAALERIGMRKTHVEPTTRGLSRQYLIFTRDMLHAR